VSAGGNPDFSPLAASYARGRPRYPPALFSFLAAQVTRHELAWDCATGSGQAAAGLAAHFARVVATDLSAEQIRHAAPNPRVEYRVAPAERSGLDAASVDLAAAAAAAHWFDAGAFDAEVRRVVRPGGLLAVWTYHLGVVEPPFDELFHRFYWETLKPYFAPATRLVDERYETLALPGEPLAAPAFTVTAEWTLDQVLDFIASWSGVPKYREARGGDPVEEIRGELARFWPDAETRRELRWPLFLQLRRL
jgi:SAM-dependent methyltransferase